MRKLGLVLVLILLGAACGREGYPAFDKGDATPAREFARACRAGVDRAISGQRATPSRDAVWTEERIDQVVGTVPPGYRQSYRLVLEGAKLSEELSRSTMEADREERATRLRELFGSDEYAQATRKMIEYIAQNDPECARQIEEAGKAAYERAYQRGREIGRRITESQPEH